MSARALVYLDHLGDEEIVTGSDGHHLQRVRRLSAGDHVIGADGAGGWRPYDISSAQNGELVLSASGESHVQEQVTPVIKVAFSLTKGQKPERVAQQLTELGIDQISVFVSDHSVLKFSDAQLEHLRRAVREAGMQCQRPRLPVVNITTFTELTQEPNLLVAQRGSDAIIPDVNDASWTVLVGPEGGFSNEETNALTNAISLGIGSNVLRAETAAVAVGAWLVAHRH